MANQMLVALDPLMGEWSVVVSSARFLQDPDDTIKGRAVLSRELDGAVVMMRVNYEDDRMPVARWVIGADDDHKTYSALYHDSRNVARVCQMSFDGSVLDIWRYSPGFTQKFNALLDATGKSLTGEWQFCKDGMNWHRDFRVHYLRH